MSRASVTRQPARLVIGGDSPALARALEQDPNTTIAYRCIYCAGYDTDEQGVRHYHHLENLDCECKPGPHWRALCSYSNEIMLWGGKGAGKSVATYGFIMRGNPPKWASPGHTDPVDVSYLNSKHYNFLVVRRTEKDLDEWFRQFRDIVEPMGAKCTESPRKVVFPSGAYGVFCHLEDWKSIMALQGKRFVRIVCEEVNQIADEKMYVEAIYLASASARSNLHPQIMLTANPGGPGESWMMRRFLHHTDDVEPWPTGVRWTDPKTNKTRVWIHSTVLDNPYYMQGNAEYAKALESLKDTDPVMYRRFYLGEIGVREGQYFERFRRKRRQDEPENAVHVVGPRLLAAWWPRGISCDWGYSHNSAVHFGCWTPERQLHVYKELVVSRMGTVELGAKIAEMALPELKQMENPHIPLYLSHDAFHRTDYTNTEAELIQRGIEQILGSGAALVASPTAEEESLPEDQAWEEVRRRAMRSGSRAAITLVPAGGPKKRKPGWQLIREYLRWWRLLDPEKESAALSRILDTEGTAAAEAVIRAIRAEQARTLPVLQIWDCCKHLIKWMEQAQEGDPDTEDVRKADGDDAGDSLNYLVSNFGFEEGQKPRDVWVADRVRSRVSQTANIHQLVMANVIAEHEWSKYATPAGVSQVRRFGRSRFGARIQ